MPTWTPFGDAHTPRFDGSSAAEWLTQAERFDRFAERFKENSELSESFRQLADGAREMARNVGD